MPTSTYELGVSGTAFTGAANREDLLDVVTLTRSEAVLGSERVQKTG